MWLSVSGRMLNVLSEMARELLIEKASSSSVPLTLKHDCLPRCRRTRSSSSSKSQRQHFVVGETSDDDFRTYRKFSADAGSHGSRQGEEGIVMSLIRRCRSRSNSRVGSRRRRSNNNDDNDDDVAEHIELDQLSGFPLSRLTRTSDAGHKFITVYVDDPVWCDKCGQLIFGVYGHYLVCQCKYFTNMLDSYHAVQYTYRTYSRTATCWSATSKL